MNVSIVSKDICGGERVDVFTYARLNFRQKGVRIISLLVGLMCSVGVSAFPVYPNHNGSLAACNLGIFVSDPNDDIPTYGKAGMAARAKAEELWLPDEESPTREATSKGAISFKYKTAWSSPVSQIPGTLYWDAAKPLWDYSLTACEVYNGCPDGYEEIALECFLECGPGEVRGDDNACHCPEGTVCADRDMGPPASCPHSGVGNPINAAIGNKYQVEVDYVDLVNPALVIKRYYNSKSERKGHYFGAVWLWEYENTKKGSIALAPKSTPPKVRVQRPSGSVYNFSFNSEDNKWVPEGATQDRLIGSTSWRYKVAGSQITEVYGRRGFLDKLYSGSLPPLEFVYDYAYDYVLPDVPPEYLAEVSDENGRKIVLKYVAKKISEITLPDGGILSYQYDSLARLSSVTYPDGEQRVYIYNDPTHTAEQNFPRALVRIEDANGKALSEWRYDTDGNAISSAKGDGLEKTEIQYNDDGSVTIINALGKQSRYHFTTINGQRKLSHVQGHASPNCAAANKFYDYYDNGTLKSKTDWEGRVTTYLRDELGREIARTEAAGTPEARTITTEYHPEFNKPTKITEPGLMTEMTYDDAGRLLSNHKISLPL